MSSIFAYDLPDSYRSSLGSALSSLPSPYQSFNDFHDELQQADFRFPGDLERALYRLKYGMTDHHGILIRNLPLDGSNIRTPINGDVQPNKTTFISEGALALLADEIGFIFGYQQERGGQLIQNIVPEKGREDINSSEGSKVELRYHIDNGYLDFRPDFLCISCINPDHEALAETRVIGNRKIIDNLNDEVVRILRQPLFQIRFSYSFKRHPEDPDWSLPKPIITGPRKYPEFRVKFGVTRGTTQEAKDALANLENICDTTLQHDTVNLQKGQVLVLSNRLALHARTPFRPRFDGADRWLQRIYVSCDPWGGRDQFGGDQRCITNLLTAESASL